MVAADYEPVQEAVKEHEPAAEAVLHRRSRKYCDIDCEKRGRSGAEVPGGVSGWPAFCKEFDHSLKEKNGKYLRLRKCEIKIWGRK
jgi:peptide methionine sulfoxide reductase MsrB